MGSNHSSSPRQRMSASEDSTAHHSTTSTSDNDDQPDLQAILAFLIRSGQVRILTNDDSDVEKEDDDSDDTEFYGPAKPPKEDPHPNTTELDNNEIKTEILELSGRAMRRNTKPTVLHMLQSREHGRNKRQQFTPGDRRIISCQYLPNNRTVVANYRHKAFCGTYSKDGDIFLSASQDQNIRVYDTKDGHFQLMKTIRAKDVGWSVLDTAFSPDGNYLIYSSWSDAIHLCNIYGDYDTHIQLPLCPGDHSFAIFSLTFSSDNREILGGANDRCLYVYDRESNTRSLRIDAHADDVNAVSFADNSSHILFSGGDDGLCKVWDRRTLRDGNPQPVGTFAGHLDGITYIDSKGDARYLLSNSKDQTIKLWDVRKFSPKEGIEATKKAVACQRWDYRWQQVPRAVSKKRSLVGDTSIMTYRGHSVLHTLIRCHFSPEYSTGQRYVYTGCATGALVIYDLLTGKVVNKLSGHTSCTRDVSWHPYENTIMSSSWDGTVQKWDYLHQEETDDPEDESDDSGDDDECRAKKRRSKRLAARREKVLKRQMVCRNNHGLFE